MHIPFMFILYKAITLRLSGYSIGGHLDLLNGAVRLKLALNLRLAGVVVDATHEKGLERIRGGLLVRVGIP